MYSQSTISTGLTLHASRLSREEIRERSILKIPFQLASHFTPHIFTREAKIGHALETRREYVKCEAWRRED